MEKLLILVMLTCGAHAFLPVADTECDATQTTLCSVTVGRSVFIQVIKNATGYRLRCKKQLNNTSINVFTLKKEKVTLLEASRNRTEFFINNGTLKIISVEKEDSGQYAVEIHTSDGLFVEIITFTLYVTEDLSVTLIVVCAALGAIAFLVVCCCLFRRVKNRKKSGAAI